MPGTHATRATVSLLSLDHVDVRSQSEDSLMLSFLCNVWCDAGPAMEGVSAGLGRTGRESRRRVNSVSLSLGTFVGIFIM